MYVYILCIIYIFYQQLYILDAHALYVTICVNNRLPPAAVVVGDGI